MTKKEHRENDHTGHEHMKHETHKDHESHGESHGHAATHAHDYESHERQATPARGAAKKSISLSTVALAALVIGLVVVSGVQAIQVSQMKNSIQELPALVEGGGVVKVGGSSSGGSGNLDSSINSLPGMVGGC